MYSSMYSKKPLLWQVPLTLVLLVLFFVLALIKLSSNQGPPRHTHPRKSRYEPCQSDTACHYKFIIYIKSAPHHFDQRQALREISWLAVDWRDEDDNPIPYLYSFVIGRTHDQLVGRQVEEEREREGDIWLSDHIDTYRSLDKKVKWSLEHVKATYNFDFIIESDSDTFINVREVDKYIKSLQLDSSSPLYFYGGSCYNDNDQVVRRSETSKHMVPRDILPRDRYPAFCHGAALLMSRAAAEEVLRLWDSGVYMEIGIDDSYIGLLVEQSDVITEVVKVPGVRKGWESCQDASMIILDVNPVSRHEELLSNYLHHGRYCPTWKYTTSFPVTL